MSTTVEKIEGKLNKEIVAFFKEHKITVKGHITFESFLQDKLLIRNMIRLGIPYALFDLMQHYTRFSESEWADFLDISTKSLQRYKAAPTHHFKPIHSEKIIEIAEVTNAGVEVFGDIEKFMTWLETPNFALGNQKPKAMLSDSYGKEMVLSELIRINHGILV